MLEVLEVTTTCVLDQWHLKQHLIFSAICSLAVTGDRFEPYKCRSVPMRVDGLCWLDTVLIFIRALPWP